MPRRTEPSTPPAQSVEVAKKNNRPETGDNALRSLGGSIVNKVIVVFGSLAAALLPIVWLATRALGGWLQTASCRTQRQPWIACCAEHRQRIKASIHHAPQNYRRHSGRQWPSRTQWAMVAVASCIVVGLVILLLSLSWHPTTTPIASGTPVRDDDYCGAFPHKATVCCHTPLSGSPKAAMPSVMRMEGMLVGRCRGPQSAAQRHGWFCAGTVEQRERGGKAVQLC